MPSPPNLTLRIAACLLASCASASCSSSDSRAQQALDAYQAATVSNDPAGARRALLQLVQAKEDVPDYWVELGKLQASMGSYGDAYYALTRAYELDRSNPQLLQALTELALRGGDLSSAEARARELEVVSPDNPWVKLTDGWAAISRSQFNDALAASEQLLANSPSDPGAILLKARALIGLNREPEAEQLLEKHVQVQPTDIGSSRTLAKIYVRNEDWNKAADLARRMSDVAPQDPNTARLLVEAAFRSGNVALGRAASARSLNAGADPALIASILDLWSDYWPSPQRIQDAKSLAAAAPNLDQKVVYAAFLSRQGSPADAVRLVGSAATLPVNAGNADANAVFGDALLRMGRLGQAKSRFDAVIAFDSGNAAALRGRSELELQARDTTAAIADAQKLVSVLPNSARDRLLLARCYSAAGNSRWADRTLWSAFQDIPADERIFAALNATVKGSSDASRQLREEFDRQRDAELNRGML